MTIYLDENLPPKLAEGLQTLQHPLNVREGTRIEVKSIKNEFGQGVDDEEWIPKLGKKKAFVITQDFNIKRIPHQAALCEKYGLVLFVLRAPKGSKYWDVVQLLVKYWRDVRGKALETKRPASFFISPRKGVKEM